ncbi:hypothetical protein RS130_01545 [Paraglaciecola aquimarina]|uniref:Virion structural protein n=1 Tax=Paraglaciecola aquimarina TaxID=1235557 RepID=A0ABU3SRY8_9ALTE|nr:hypothetical protein [Paraglaciecola aquimarina]MDU0352781.1 hypothetical protein [Paraglaciecola aquimarina]
MQNFTGFFNDTGVASSRTITIPIGQQGIEDVIEWLPSNNLATVEVLKHTKSPLIFTQVPSENNWDPTMREVVIKTRFAPNIDGSNSLVNVADISDFTFGQGNDSWAITDWILKVEDNLGNPKEFVTADTDTIVDIITWTNITTNKIVISKGRWGYIHKR